MRLFGVFGIQKFVSPCQVSFHSMMKIMDFLFEVDLLDNRLLHQEYFFMIKMIKINKFTKLKNEKERQMADFINNYLRCCEQKYINMQQEYKQSIIPFDILPKKYHSSQIYYYTRIMSQIVQQKEGKVNNHYEDLNCYFDDDQYLKRYYQDSQFSGKMATFKQYYFYHEDCPRIHMKNIEVAYGKWQDRKRDLVYRKLKVLFNEGSFSQSQDDAIHQNLPGSHFLLNISEYNPFSKKYYLRVQARRQKQKQLKKHQKTQTQLENLNHQLSLMLHQINDLSQISTFPSSSKKIENKFKKDEKKLYDPTRSTSQQLSSQNYPQSYSSIKLNFQKHKLSSSQKNSTQKISDLYHDSGNKKINIQFHRQSSGGNSGQKQYLDHKGSGKITPKMSKDQHPGLESLKSKSIYEVSSFGTLKVNQKEKHLINKDREQLKLNFDSNIKGSNNKLKKSKDERQKYKSEKVSEKKVVIKVRSNGKIGPSPQLEKVRRREQSKRKFQTKPDEFGDDRLHVNEEVKKQTKLRSHKSEFAKSKPISIGNTVNNTGSKKNLFQIKNIRQQFMNKISSKKQKILEIKNS